MLARAPDTEVITGLDVTLRCTPPQQLEIDGELKTPTPVRLSIAAEALNVVGSQAFEDR